MADNTYSGLTVGVQLDTFTGDYLIGAELGGAFVPFYRLSQSRLEKYLARAAQAQAAAPPPPPVEQPAQ